jgi:hypothetical protein
MGPKVTFCTQLCVDTEGVWISHSHISKYNDIIREKPLNNKLIPSTLWRGWQWGFLVRGQSVLF